MAFRMAYSLLDKVAYFLNNYLALGIPERMVNFHTFWYIKQKRQSSFDRNLKLPTTGRCVGCSG